MRSNKAKQCKISEGVIYVHLHIMQTNKTLLITEIFHYFSVVSACAHVCVCEDTYKSKPFLAKVRS